MRTSRKSLWASGISVVICAMLLVGTTFAWFTDSITNSGNKIQAGELNITLSELNSEGNYVEVGESPIFESELWEPGYSDAAVLKVANEGSLALEWRLDLVNKGGEAGILGEVIDVYAKVSEGSAITTVPTSLEAAQADGYTLVGTLNELMADADGAAHGILYAADNTPAGGYSEAYAGVVLHMRESADNDYQGLSVGTTFDIVLNATQYTYEEDGFGSSTYDASANFENAKEVTAAGGGVISSDEFSQSLNDSEWENITYLSDVQIDEDLNIYTDSNLNFGGNTLHANETLYIGRNNSYGSAPSTVTIENLNFDMADTRNGYIRCEDSCSVTFRDVTFSSDASSSSRAIQVYASNDGSINTYVFENCVFDNTYVSFEGGSGASYQFNVRFVNCTFTGTVGNGGYMAGFDSYIYGDAVFENCSFDVTGAGNATAAVSARPTASYTGDNPLNITLNNVTFTGTSTSGYWSTYRPVMLRISSTGIVNVTELGDCSYTIDGEPTTYDGSVLVSDAGSMADLIASGGGVAVAEDMVLPSQIILNGDTDTTLDLAGNTVTFDGAGIIDLYGNSSITINGNGAIDQEMTSDLGYLVRAGENSEVVIEDGTFTAGLTCVQAGGNSQVKIYGGFFKALTTYDDRCWILNLIDKSNAAIEVYGGTFVNYDPTNSVTENPADNFVADGYKVVSEDKGNGEIWYTVVPE